MSGGSVKNLDELLFSLIDRQHFYPDAEVRALVPLGYVEIKKSKYAEYAVLTPMGVVASEQSAARIQAATRASAREAGASAAEGPGSPKAAVFLGRSGRPRPAAPEKKAGPSSHAASPVVAQTAPLKAAPQRPPAKKRATPLTPNACRVTLGTKVAYYPVSAFGGLSGSKVLVVTLNKHYRSYSVAASAGDLVVPA